MEWVAYPFLLRVFIRIWPGVAGFCFCPILPCKCHRFLHFILLALQRKSYCLDSLLNFGLIVYLIQPQIYIEYQLYKKSSNCCKYIVEFTNIRFTGVPIQSTLLGNPEKPVCLQVLNECYVQKVLFINSACVYLITIQLYILSLFGFMYGFYIVINIRS